VPPATPSAPAVSPLAVGPKIAMTVPDTSAVDMTPGPPRASLQFQPIAKQRAYGARSVRKADQAVTRADCVPRRVVDVEPSMRTSTSAPASATPLKLTVVFRRVRPRRVAGSVLLGPSTSTRSFHPRPLA